MISLRLTSDKLEKLYAVMDKIGVGRVRNGEDRSEKLRKFIDSLYEHHIVNNPSTVTTENPHIRQCYMNNYRTVSVKEVCEPCRLKAPKEFLNCPEVNKELGVSP